MKAPWRILLAACGIAVLSSCATIPTSGPIRQGVEVGDTAADQVIRVIARPPEPDMTPAQIVSGFIEASASFEGDHAIAREYLTPDAALTWDPGAGTRVYEGVPTLVPNGPNTVDMTATEAGSIDLQGRFQAAMPGRILRDAFTLDFIGGQWRIANPPQGLLLARSDIDRAFRSYDVYFLDPEFTTLVPDPRLIPVDGPGLATTLMRALAEGPTEWLAPAVRTALPDGAGLAVNAVPVQDGVAKVDLDPSVRLVDEPTRRALSAQIVWTLGQVPGVRSVDLNAGGQVLTVVGAPNPQPEGTWPGFDPNAMPSGAAAYAVSNGRVSQLVGDLLVPVSGGAATGIPPLDGIAVSLDGSLIAGLGEEATLWLADVTPGSVAREIVAEPGQSRPSFGRGTSAWFVGPDGLLRVARPDATVVTIPVDGLSAKVQLESVAISRDGTRAALIVRRGPRSFVMLAVIVLREGSARLQSPIRVESRLTSVADVAWSDDQHLVVVGAEGAASPDVYDIDLARGVVRSLGSPDTPLRIAAAPGFPLLVASGDGLLYSDATGPWRPGPTATSPAYPGG